MERLIAIFKELKETLKSGVKDYSLLSQLNTALSQIKLEANIVSIYCDVLFKLYDLSNSATFIKSPPNFKQHQSITLEDMAINIKVIVLKMLGNLVAFFNDNPNVELPHYLIEQSLQIMIMLSRVLLDLDRVNEVRSIYPLVKTYRQAVGHVKNGEIQLAHWLNILQLIHIDVDCKKIDVFQFKNALQVIQNAGENTKNEGYLQFSQHLAFQTVLKLLKKGQINQAKTLANVLPEKMSKSVQDLINLNPKSIQQQNPSFKMSPFYELYLQIKNSGISNISQQKLKMFISDEQNFNDPRIFDVVALTGQILPLYIWLQIHLNHRGKPEIIHTAIRCFIYLIDTQLQQKESNNLNLFHQWQSKKQTLHKFLPLSKLIMVAVLTEKKQNAEPILNLVKKLTKLLICFVITLYPNTSMIQQYTQKLQLICNKYGLTQVSRSISCIYFYYELIMGTVTEQSYAKFCKINLLDKGSQLFRTLKLAYECRTGKEISANEQKDILSKDPFIVMLFAKQPHQELILHYQPKVMAKMSEKWQCYLLLLQVDQTNLPTEQLISKLMSHFEQTLLWCEWESMTQLEYTYIQDITFILNTLLNNQSVIYSANCKIKICRVLLYLISVKYCRPKLHVLNGTINLNRYSKLLKLLSLANEAASKSEFKETNKFLQFQLFLAKSYMSYQLQDLKLQKEHGQAVNQAGLIVLMQLFLQFIKKHENNAQAREFFTFIRFEILCLLDSFPDSEINFQNNLQLLKLYCSSRYIKKPTKLKILRKLMRQDLVSEGKIMSLQQLCQLIQIAEDRAEKARYASYIIRTYGEDGKAYLMLQSNRRPKQFQFLVEEDCDLDDC